MLPRKEKLCFSTLLTALPLAPWRDSGAGDHPPSGQEQSLVQRLFPQRSTPAAQIKPGHCFLCGSFDADFQPPTRVVLPSHCWSVERAGGSPTTSALPESTRANPCVPGTMCQRGKATYARPFLERTLTTSAAFSFFLREKNRSCTTSKKWL